MQTLIGRTQAGRVRSGSAFSSVADSRRSRSVVVKVNKILKLGQVLSAICD